MLMMMMMMMLMKPLRRSCTRVSLYIDKQNNFNYHLGTTESGLVRVVGSSSKMEATSVPCGTGTR